MELKFTPRNIVEIENEMKKPIQDVLQSFSFTALVLFVKKGLGMGATDEDAYKAIEEEKDKGKDIAGLYLEVMKALQNDGYLDKDVDIDKIESEAKDGAVTEALKSSKKASSPSE